MLPATSRSLLCYVSHVSFLSIRVPTLWIGTTFRRMDDKTLLSDHSDCSSSLYDEQLDHPFLDQLSSECPEQVAHQVCEEYRRWKVQNGRKNIVTEASSPSSSDHPLCLHFAQAFGDRSIDAPCPILLEETDVLSCVNFNRHNGMIASGDKAGRIILFKRVSTARQHDMQPQRLTVPLTKQAPASNDSFDVCEVQDDDDTCDNTIVATDGSRFASVPQFRFWTQFQSHESEFDYLKSIDIEEKINAIRWCRHSGDACRLIATNDKTIKVWRVSETEVKSVARLTPPVPSPAPPPTRWLHAAVDLPRLEPLGKGIKATPRRVFSNAHAYHINSISVNSDEETFLSSDDLRVHLWNMNASGVGFNILDIKPTKMADLTEIITSTEFHPHHCHMFALTTSQGSVKLHDLRLSALCERSVRTFQVPQVHVSRSTFFTDVMASISDAKFSPDGRYILTRDFMNLRLWDMHMERDPIRVIPVHEHLRSRMVDLYENDCIFDKFHCCFSNDGGSLITGSYNSLLQVYSAATGKGIGVEASVEFAAGVSSKYNARISNEGNLVGSGPIELTDPTKRIMRLDASSLEPIVAAATGPSLYIYHGIDQVRR